MFQIGDSLREARTRQGLEFLQLEQTTKIRAKYLRALETEDFDSLPSPTYVKGFLRAYADFLGLDGQLYADEYTTRFFVDDEDSLRRPRRVRVRPQPYRRLERNVVVVALVAIAVITALIIAAWRFGSGDGSGPAPDPSPARVALQQGGSGTRAYATLVVRAVRGSSLLQVRAGSAAGRLLYQGTLELGQSQRFVARRLWVNLGSPENLRLRLNDRAIAIGGSCPRVLQVAARRFTSAARCS